MLKNIERGKIITNNYPQNYPLQIEVEFLGPKQLTMKVKYGTEEYSGHSDTGMQLAIQPVAYELRGVMKVEDINGIKNVKFSPLKIYSDFISQEDIRNEIMTLEYDGYRILSADVDVYCIYVNNSREYLKTTKIEIN